jgi:membrane protein insertase Oxa1/YidC/SpoIIIJ
MGKSDQTRSTVTIWLSSLILAGSMVMSYGNQAEYLMSIGFGWGSWILPLMLDLMVLTANVAIGVIALTTKERTKIRRIMWAALLASAWTNFAGGHNPKVGIYHASAVLLYLAAEKIVTIVVEAITRAKAAQAAAQAMPRVTPEEPVRVVPEPVEEAQRVVQAEVTRLPVPVSPAPQAPADRTALQRREVRSPLTGRVLTERPPIK